MPNKQHEELNRLLRGEGSVAEKTRIARALDDEQLQMAAPHSKYAKEELERRRAERVLQAHSRWYTRPAGIIGLGIVASLIAAVLYAYFTDQFNFGLRGMTPLGWKMTVQVVSVMTAIVIALLDYKWSDKRTNLFKRLRAGLFILLGALLVFNIFQSYTEAQEQLDRERHVVNRIAKHLLSESSHNFGMIQIKGAGSWDLFMRPPTDQTALRYQLSMLKLPKFATQVPRVWSADLKLLANFRPEGERSYSALLSLYDLLEKSEKDEEELMRLIEIEQRPEARRGLIAALHKQHDRTRAEITESAKHFEALYRRTEESK